MKFPANLFNLQSLLYNGISIVNKSLRDAPGAPSSNVGKMQKKNPIRKGRTFFTRRSRGCCVAIDMMTFQQTDIIPHTSAVAMPACFYQPAAAACNSWNPQRRGFSKWRKTSAVCPFICTYTLSDFSEANTSEQSLRLLSKEHKRGYGLVSFLLFSFFSGYLTTVILLHCLRFLGFEFFPYCSTSYHSPNILGYISPAH